MKKICLLLGLFLLGGRLCGAKNELKQQPKEQNAIVQFSLDMLSKNIEQENNVAFSPILLHSMFSLLANGSEDETREKIELLLNCNTVDIQAYYKTLFNTCFSNDVIVLNSAWINKNLKLTNSFTNSFKDFPFIYVKNTDFSDKKSEEQINHWIDSCTNHVFENFAYKIKSEKEIFLIISTLYFKNNWEYTFSKKRNSTDCFFSPYGKNPNVVFMNNTTYYQYFSNKISKGLILRYEKSNFSFFILLPNKNISLKEYLQKTSGVNFTETLRNAQEKYIDLYLPKFKIEYTNKLKNTLSQMGFDLFRLGFSKITEGKTLFIDEVLQNTFIEVNEKGTEAGSLLSIGFNDGGKGRSPRPIKLKFDRPFIFGIINTQTNIPILIGAVNKL